MSTATDSITRKLAEWASGVTFNDLPSSLVQLMKKVVFDSVGCSLGGYASNRSKIARAYVEELGGWPQASIIGGGKTSWSLAAFLNAELMNALDYDVTGPGVSGHTTPYVMPPALALAERSEASGKELITALALGHELSNRMCSSIAMHRVAKDEPPYWEDSPRFSYTYNIFGAAAAASRMLDLDAARTAHAMGIAGQSTPVPAGQKWEMTGGPGIMAKYGCWPGWMSQLATQSALLAERGFTGDNTILDGDWGFWKIYGSPFFKKENLFDELGKKWEERMTFKPYPCCGANHAGIEGLNELIVKNNIDPETIKEIVIKGDGRLVLPCRSADEIVTWEDTQFSNRYIFAVAAFHGRKPGVYWQSPVTFKDPRIANLMKNVHIELHPDAEKLIAAEVKGGRFRSVNRTTLVEITADGKKYSTQVGVQRGSPANPMTDDEFKEKFRDNAYHSPVTISRVEELMDALWHLDEVDNVAELCLGT